MTKDIDLKTPVTPGAECRGRQSDQTNPPSGNPRVVVVSGTDPWEVLERFCKQKGWGEFKRHGVSLAEYRRLVGLGWRPPDSCQSDGGKKGAAKRQAITSWRHLLVKRYLRDLPPTYRRHPYSEQTVKMVHKQLVALASLREARGSAVLRHCRKVKVTTIRADIVKIMRNKVVAELVR